MLTTFKGCSHNTIVNAIFIATNELYGIQNKCSHGATVTTLNPLQPVSCEKYIAVVVVPCEQAFSPSI